MIPTIPKEEWDDRVKELWQKKPLPDVREQFEVDLICLLGSYGAVGQTPERVRLALAELQSATSEWLNWSGAK